MSVQKRVKNSPGFHALHVGLPRSVPIPWTLTRSHTYDPVLNSSIGSFDIVKNYVVRFKRATAQPEGNTKNVIVTREASIRYHRTLVVSKIGNKLHFGIEKISDTDFLVFNKTKVAKNLFDFHPCVMCYRIALFVVG